MHESLINIRRAPYQSLSMLLIQVFVSFLVLAVASGTIFILALLNSVESEPKIIVYFKPLTAEATIFKVREYLVSSSQIADITYVDKMAAYALYKEQANGSQPLIDDTSPDIFPPSLEIKAKNATYLENIASYLQRQPDVDEVQYQKNTVTKLLAITNAIRWSIIAFVGYLALMTIVTLTTMTNFKIALRKEEIEIYELLGATSGYITKPFYTESYILTLVSGFIGSGLFVGGLLYLQPSLATYLQGITRLSYTAYNQTLIVRPYNYMTIGIICSATLLLMIIISGVSTKLATRKYLV